MTTTCSSWPLVWCSGVLTACVTSQPLKPPHSDLVGTLTAPEVRRTQATSPTARGGMGGAPYVQWTEISHGSGNGHVLPDVHVAMVMVSASNDLAKSYYCEGRPFEPGATFGIAEALQLDDDKTLYYIIERTSDEQWRYLVHADGETVDGAPLCADCHAQAGIDPFFRPFRDVGCR